MITPPPYLKVQGEAGLVRDTSSNAILATDLAAKRAHMEREKRELNIAKIGELSNRMDNFENSLRDVKGLLETLINNLSPKNNNTPS